MTVFLLIIDAVYNGEWYDSKYPLIFDTLEKAQAEFKRFVDDEKPKCENDGWIIEDNANDDEYFEAYEDGYFDMNHCIARIIEREVL